MFESKLSQRRLKKIIAYCARTGSFRWREKRKGVSFDSPPGGIHQTISGNKYRRIMIDGKQYLAHRLAWLYVHGKFPDRCIDHIDGDGLNNKLRNLREATYTENQQNAKIRADSKSRVTGVYFVKGRNRWRGQITVNKEQKHLGCFMTKEEAVEARHSAEAKYKFHENHGKRL